MKDANLAAKVNKRSTVLAIGIMLIALLTQVGTRADDTGFYLWDWVVVVLAGCAAAYLETSARISDGVLVVGNPIWRYELPLGLVHFAGGARFPVVLSGDWRVTLFAAEAHNWQVAVGAPSVVHRAQLLIETAQAECPRVGDEPSRTLSRHRLLLVVLALFSTLALMIEAGI